jgi:hypothetical protein
MSAGLPAARFDIIVTRLKQAVPTENLTQDDARLGVW